MGATQDVTTKAEQKHQEEDDIMNPKKDVKDLTINELNSLRDTLKMFNRIDMLNEVEKEISRRAKNKIAR